MESCVLPIAAADALAWISGKLHDADLLLRPSRPDCAFLLNLPNRAAWRDAIQRILRLRSQGAKFMVMRTGTPIVIRHILHYGGSCTLKETVRDQLGNELVKYRFILMPTQFELYFSRLEKLL